MAFLSVFRLCCIANIYCMVFLQFGWPIGEGIESSVTAGDLTPNTTAARFLLEWGKKGAEPGQFHSPIGIAISETDHIFVADFKNARIQQFDTNGKFVAA